jgi:hypothetical protein
MCGVDAIKKRRLWLGSLLRREERRPKGLLGYFAVV